jgi:hypothetical protein
MAENVRGTFLNIGCGMDKMPGWVNVDRYDICKPDVVLDLNKPEWPWADNSVDGILAKHVLEHLSEYWTAFKECGRILKVGGTLEVRVPDASSDDALGFRDHLRLFNGNSFFGILGYRHGTNAFAMKEQESVPLRLVSFNRVPFKKYYWMPQRLLKFCAEHMRNFVWEQRFVFRKENPDREGK